MKITASENGPYLIEISNAEIIKGGSSEKLDRKMIALCRCGQSENKPFCDGKHKAAGFNAEKVELNVS